MWLKTPMSLRGGLALHRLRSLCTRPFESSYDLVLSRLSSVENRSSFNSLQPWNALINDLIEQRLPPYSETLKRSIQRSINYRHDIHRGNLASMDIVSSFRKQLESSLTEDNIHTFILRVIRDLGDPELALHYLQFIRRSKESSKTSLPTQCLVLEAVARSSNVMKPGSDVEREILDIAQESLEQILSLDLRNRNIFYVIGAYANSSLWEEKALPLYLSSVASNPKEDLEERVTRSSVRAGEILARRILRERGPSKDYWDVLRNNNFITSNFQLRYVQVEDVQKSHDRVYVDYIQSADLGDLRAMLEFWRDNWSLVSWDVARVLKEKLPNNVSFRIEEMPNGGTCNVCSTQLGSDKFSHSDMETLREVIYNKCLKKTDIYLSSLPGEVRRFNSFVKKLSKFDVVVDGLNVALSHLPKFQEGSVSKSKVGYKVMLSQSKNVLGVLRTLHNRGLKNIVLIHRDGIERYPDIAEISSLCHIYTAKRESQDDPFMILATLSSGLDTLFVSNDRLRQHNYLLEDPELKRLFTRWQLAHQCFHKVWVTPDKAQGRMNYRYIVTHPQSFEIRTQESNGVWHIPLLNKYEENKGHLSVPKYWICADSSSFP